MPIRPDLRHHYSRKAGWPEIQARILERAAWSCECTGQCGARHRGGRCSVPHRAYVARPVDAPLAWTVVEQGAVVAGAKVIRVLIGIAHLDHQPTNNDPANLLALCQRCHLAYDLREHLRIRAILGRERERERTHEAWLEARRRGQLDLVLDLLHPRAQVEGNEP